MFSSDFHDLVERNCLATTRYHAAITKLTALAGRGKAASFEAAKLNCKLCLDDCRRTRDAVREYRAAHGS